MTVKARLRRAAAIVVTGTCLVAPAASVAAAPAPAAPAGTTASAPAAPRATTISAALALLESGRADTARVEGLPNLPTLVLRVGRTSYTTPVADALLPRVVDAAKAGDVPLRLVGPRPIRIDSIRDEISGETGGGFDIGEWVQTWGPLILMAGLVLVGGMAVRQVGGARFGRRTKPTSTTVRFDEVAGIDEIRDEVVEIADFLREPERFRRLGATLPRGVLLYGAPGTGKTLLARAIAGEAGVPFFSASGSEFVEVYAGLGSRRVRALFEAARKAAPAVVYIDEIDAVGGVRTGGPGSGEREQTLDQLLAEMDGFATDTDRPVVVLASTNRLNDLDPALVRSGRFDRKIAVGLPGREAREAILEVHTRNRPLAPDVDVAAVAAFTVGLAGADLAALCNEASFEAARAGKDALELGDFRRALLRLAAGPEKRSRIMTEDERRLVAYHEIGHALVGHLSPRCDAVERVTVIPQGQALGVTISLPDEDRFLYTRRDGLERLSMILAGRAAEEVVFGEMTSGAADDLSRATALARRMVAELAMGEETTALSITAAGPADEAGEERVERQARALLEEAYRRACTMVEERIDSVHAAAEALLASEAIGREELDELFGPRPPRARFVPRRPAAGEAAPGA
ncbi:MAG: AAA family ATPase [Actinomycetota bacterium]